MNRPTIPERIEIVKKELNITEDVQFGKLCGMTKSVVNQLKTGKMKSFAARYAYKLEENSGFCAKWLQLGEGPQKLDPDIKQAMKIMESMRPPRRKDAVKVVSSLTESAEGTNGK
jgi:hypothetical protein